MIFGIPSSNEKNIATALGVNPYFKKDYLQSAKNMASKALSRFYYYYMVIIYVVLVLTMAVQTMLV